MGILLVTLALKRAVSVSDVGALNVLFQEHQLIANQIVKKHLNRFIYQAAFLQNQGKEKGDLEEAPCSEGTRQRCLF